jgi:uncharacterized C2H2 Zn-finger protein
MESRNFACYYQGCGKVYQSQAILVRHINSFHLNRIVSKCPVCLKFLISVEDFQKHKNIHLLKEKRAFSVGFLLSEHYRDVREDFSPCSILKFPVLPPIDNERKDPKFLSKLPMSPEILTELLKK